MKVIYKILIYAIVITALIFAIEVHYTLAIGMVYVGYDFNILRCKIELGIFVFGGIGMVYLMYKDLNKDLKGDVE